MGIFNRNAQLPRDEQIQPTVTALRMVFALIGAAALGLGVYGLNDYLIARHAEGRDPLNLLYGTLQLFVMGSDPLQGGTNFPWTLQVARFAAPAVTLFAVTEACRLLLAAEMRRLRARRSRGHVVVCGDTSVARTLARRLHAAGERVVVVRRQPIGALELRRRALLGVNGDPRDPDVLRGAGAGRATVIYACSDDSATNVDVATTAAGLVARRGGTAAVYAQIHDAEQALALQARRLGAAGGNTLRLDFFDLEQLAAHVLLTQHPLGPRGGSPPRVLVAGDSPFSRALVVELGRHWRLRRRDDATPMRVDVVAAEATHVVGDLAGRHVMLRDTCHLVSHDVDLATFLAADAGERYERAFVCYPDEEQSLRVALTVNRLWHRVAGEVVVPVDRFSGLVDAFRVGAPAPLLDRLGGRLRLFPWVSAGCDPKLIAEDLSERLAQLNHERYLAGCLARGEKMGARPTLVEWAMLDEAARRTSREQAGDIGAKLHVIGCSILPRDFDDDGFEFTDGEIEELAKLEQQRWKADAERHGWQWGGERDSLTRRTPDLVDWDRLGTDGREKCRAAIRDIPLILADAGFQVVRMADNEEDRALRLV